MSSKEEIRTGGVMPAHVAIIMDGNGRWAKEQGKERVYGHQYGVEAVRNTLKAAQEIGLEYLTLYTFSKENWNRPKEEVDALMELMVDAIARETADLMRNGVRMKVIGNTADLPEKVSLKLDELIGKTAENRGVTLVLALSYGARWEILEAARRLAADCRDGKLSEPGEWSEELFAGYLTTGGIPDPDLLIRTGGECRLSNFLLWQCAYTEFYFIDKFWPDFGKDDLYLAIREFQRRERRFGRTGEQLK